MTTRIASLLVGLALASMTAACSNGSVDSDIRGSNLSAADGALGGVGTDADESVDPAEVGGDLSESESACPNGGFWGDGAEPDSACPNGGFWGDSTDPAAP